MTFVSIVNRSEGNLRAAVVRFFFYLWEKIGFPFLSHSSAQMHSVHFCLKGNRNNAMADLSGAFDKIRVCATSFLPLQSPRFHIQCMCVRAVHNLVRYDFSVSHVYVCVCVCEVNACRIKRKSKLERQIAPTSSNVNHDKWTKLTNFSPVKIYRFVLLISCPVAMMRTHAMDQRIDPLAKNIVCVVG